MIRIPQMHLIMSIRIMSKLLDRTIIGRFSKCCVPPLIRSFSYMLKLNCLSLKSESQPRKIIVEWEKCDKNMRTLENGSKLIMGDD